MALSMGKQGIKSVALTSLIVLVWLVWKLDLHEPVRANISSHKHPPATADTGDAASRAVHSDVILDAGAAEEYCSRFRLEPFPRDRAAQRKIFDLLLVNSELETLEMRMGQMAPGVDYFVVLESDMTFTDHPKPLYVESGWARFAAFHAQMIRRTMDLSTPDFNTTWEREGASRNAMYSQVVPFLEGEQEARPDDVLLVSDLDEIFKPEALRVLRNCRIPDRVTAKSPLYYYSYQWRMSDAWMHPQATVYKGKVSGGNDTTIQPEVLRHHTSDHFVLDDAGWHCSYCFPTVEEIVRKITSFSHTELDKDLFKDPDWIVARVRSGRDLFDRDNNATRIEKNRDVPDFLLSHRDMFGYMIDRDPKNANFRDYKPR